MSRTCDNCLHSRPCHMRIELVKQINRFKYLAANVQEVDNTSAEGTVSDIFDATARACTLFQSTSVDLARKSP